MADPIEEAIRSHVDAADYRAAVQVALEGYGRELMGFLHNRLRDEDASAEVFSRVGEDIWGGIERFRWASSFRTWMYVIARNALYRFKEEESHGKRHVAISQVSQMSELVERHRTSTLEYLRTEAKDRLAELRATLDPEDQTLLLLRIHRSLSWKDVALVMDGVEHMSEEEHTRAAARYRQRFQTVKHQLKEKARASGLLTGD